MIEPRHHVMTDERLEWLAERFVGGSYHRLLKVSFAEYLRDPDGYDFVAQVLEGGGALRRVAMPPVELNRCGWEFLHRGVATGKVMRARLSTHN